MQEAVDPTTALRRASLHSSDLSEQHNPLPVVFAILLLDNQFRKMQLLLQDLKYASHRVKHLQKGQSTARRFVLRVFLPAKDCLMSRMCGLLPGT